MAETKDLPVLYVPAGTAIDPKPYKGWQYRMEVQSETSDSIYVVSQNVKDKYWACTCFGFRRYKKCKHLEAMGLPCFHKPFEVQLK